MRYTFVTVAHLPDLPFIKLQARSLDRYLDRRMVERIILIDNTAGNGSLPQDEVLPQYGTLPITVMRARDLSPLAPRTCGWISQQIYKLLIARRLTTERYLVLDSKNHLIGPFRPEMIEAPDGRIRTGHRDYTGHTLLPYLTRSCAYQGVKASQIMKYFVPTTPPFTFKTLIVRNLIADIERRERTRFADAFFTRKLTEFFLYGAYVFAKDNSLERHYKFDNWVGENIWSHYSNKAMQDIIAKTAKPFFSAHRRSFRHMDAKTRHALAKL